MFKLVAGQVFLVPG